MRAVNLLPRDLRSAGAGGGSGSGAGAYALLAALAAVVLIVGFWAATTRQVKDREVEVTRLNAEAAAAEAQAGSLSSYENTVKVAQTRRQAVIDLINARFDWAGALEDVSRTVPDNGWLTTLTATVAPGVSVEGGVSNPLRATVASPAIEVTGCTTGHEEVAALMSRLRSMKGVTRVSLATSEKNDVNGGAGTSDSAAGGSSDCTSGSGQRPKFNLVVFYGDGQAAASSDAAGGNAAAAAAAAPSASGGTQ